MALQTSNSSAACAFLDCVLDKANISSNASLEEVNYTTCRNGSVNQPPSPSRQKDAGSIRILLYSLIFLLSVFGNLLIIVVLMLNKRMRTVTNSFLLSLAISDLMMAVFCMPFTLIPSIMQDFIFGAAVCKILTYCMGISVSISTFSLVAIAIERYSAICNPLKSRSWQTRSHAYRVITATWVLSLLIMVPYPVTNVIKTSVRKSDNTTVHMCRAEWPSVWAEQTWYVLLLFTLFFVPGVVMMIAYGLISRELYRGIQFEQSLNTEATGMKNGRNIVTGGNDDSDGCYVQVSKRTPSATELRTLSASTSISTSGQATMTERARSNTSEAKLRAKKRVIRMLMVIVALFFVCWMPLYTANTWKAFDPPSAHRALGGAPISFIQLLAYTSACVNPIIYCFMNTRFRMALLSTFACCCGSVRLCRGGRFFWRGGRRQGGEGGDDCLTAASSMATSMSKISYTTVSTAGPC